MRAVEHRSAVLSGNPGVTPRIWRAVKGALGRCTGGREEPFSAAICILLLLLVGLMVKLAPIIHLYLAQT